MDIRERTAAPPFASPSRRRTRGLERMLASRLGAGIAYLAGGQAVNLLLSLGSFVLITRLLGVERYGVWVTVLDALTILLAIAAFGLPLAAVHAIAGLDGEAYVVPALALRLLSTLLVGGAALAVVLLSGKRDVYGLPAVIAAPGFLASSVLAACEEALRARTQFRQAAVIENVARALLVGTLVALAALARAGAILRPGVSVLMAAWSITWCLALVLALRMVRPQLPASRASRKAAWAAGGRLWRATPLLGAIALVALFRFRVEVVLLGVLRSSAEAAQFAVASRVYTVALVVPEVVIAALFPYLVQARRRSSGDVDHEARLVTLLVLGAGVIVSAILATSAPYVVRIMAGAGYAHAAVDERILALLIAPGYLTSVLTILLVEARRYRAAALALLVPALVAYCFEAALVGRFGQAVCLAGGCGAMLASCALLLVLCLRGNGAAYPALISRPELGEGQTSPTARLG